MNPRYYIADVEGSDSFVIETSENKDAIQILDEVMNYLHGEGFCNTITRTGPDSTIIVYWETVQADQYDTVEEFKVFLIPQREIYR